MHAPSRSRANRTGRRAATLLVGLAVATGLTVLAPAGEAFAATTTISDSSSCVAYGGTWQPMDGSCRITSSKTIASGDTLVVSVSTDFATLTNNGTLTIDSSASVTTGTFVNNASAVLNAGGWMFRVYGSGMTNHGTIYNTAGELGMARVGSNDGTIEVSHQFLLTDSFANSGTITIQCGGYITLMLDGVITGTPPTYLCAPPSVSPAVTGTTGAGGWYRSDVGISWTVSGEQSSSGCGPVTVTADTASSTFTCSATNANGTTNSPVTVQRDTMAPSVSATATRADTTAYTVGTWTNQAVTVHASCSDSTSGVASCPSDQTVMADGSTTASGTVTDVAGNSAALSFGPILIDTVAPSVAVTGPTGGATYSTSNVPAAGCSTTDADSGVATTATVQLTGGPVGAVTATCSGGTDAAGNAAPPVAVSYTVAVVAAEWAYSPSGVVASSEHAVSGGNGTAVVTFTLDHPAPSTGLEADWWTIDGTATSPDDYTAASGTVQFAPGATSASVSVGLVDDSMVESSESFTVAMSSLRVPTTPISVTLHILDAPPAAAVQVQVDIADDDVTTTTGAPATSEAPATTEAVAPATTEAPASIVTVSGTLPSTGSDTSTALQLALAAVAIGSVLLGSRRLARYRAS